jgi:hypothetical protein
MQRRLLATGTLVVLCCTIATAHATASEAQPVGCPSADSPTQQQRLIDEQRYIDWVASASPEELVAAFGRGTP